MGTRVLRVKSIGHYTGQRVEYFFSFFPFKLKNIARRRCSADRLAKVTTNILVLYSETDFKILIARKNTENERNGGSTNEKLRVRHL